MKENLTCKDVAPGIRIGIFGNSCFDLEIDPDVSVMQFTGSERFTLDDDFKQFPNIKTIVISSEVKEITVSNFMFPNVRYVKSRSTFFMTESMLIQKSIYANSLLNAFCRNVDEVIDLKNVNIIKSGAFNGCLSTNIINTVGIRGCYMNAFKGSGMLMNPSKDGAYILNHILIDVDYSKDELVIPKEVTLLSAGIKFKKFKKVTSNIAASYKMQSYPETLVIDDEERMMEQRAVDILHANSRCKYFEIPNSNHSFKSIDGIIYSKDGKRLISCPKKRSGKVVIPNGVEVIQEIAFDSCDIEEIVIPDSVKTVGHNAFSSCRYLTKATLGNGLTEAANRMFFYNMSLEEVIFPQNITSIDSFAFYETCLGKIDIPEGVETIGKFAFASALKEVSLPSTLKTIGASALLGVDKINLKSMPDGLVSSIVNKTSYSIVANGFYGYTEVRFETESGEIRTAYIPKCILKKDIENVHEIVKTFFETCNTDDIQSIFKYANDVISKQDTAFAIYKKYKCSDAASYLKKSASKMIQRFIEMKNEECIIDIVKTGLVNNKVLENSVQKVHDLGMTTAEAYMLEGMQKKCKKTREFSL